MMEKTHQENNILYATHIDTPLGQMIAIADQKLLFILDFVDRRGLERKIENLKLKTNSTIVSGEAPATTLIAKELQNYFAGTLTEFKTPLYFSGSPFQQSVWQELQKIPYGKTCSYAQLARTIGKPSAFRAVAQANGANYLALIVPCHRVINTNGLLGGYGGGITRKQSLINLEKESCSYISSTM